MSDRPASQGDRPTTIDAPVAPSEKRDHLFNRRLGPHFLLETVDGGRQRQALAKEDAKRLADVLDVRPAHAGPAHTCCVGAYRGVNVFLADGRWILVGGAG